jgi:hypothetical protein
MTDTDYKRLWRNAKEENIKLLNQLDMLNKQLEAQIDVINKIREGEISIAEIVDYMPKDNRKEVIEFLKKQKKEVEEGKHG